MVGDGRQTCDELCTGTCQAGNKLSSEQSRRMHASSEHCRLVGGDIYRRAAWYFLSSFLPTQTWHTDLWSQWRTFGWQGDTFTPTGISTRRALELASSRFVCSSCAASGYNRRLAPTARSVRCCCNRSYVFTQHLLLSQCHNCTLGLEVRGKRMLEESLLHCSNGNSQ